MELITVTEPKILILNEFDMLEECYMCVRHDAHLPLFFCWQEKPRVDVRKFVKIGRPGYKGTTVSLILRLSPCMTLFIVQAMESWAGPGNKATAHMTLFYLLQLRNREIRTVDNTACFSR